MICLAESSTDAYDRAWALVGDEGDGAMVIRMGRTLALVAAVIAALALVGRTEAQSKAGSRSVRGAMSVHATQAPAAGGAAKESDPIALEEERCLQAPAGMSTVGMMECERHAYDAYDKRLNMVYAQVLREVDVKSAELIRQAQRAWLAWRRAELAAYGGPWRADRGTMIGPELAATRVEAVKSRVVQLQLYLPN